MNQPSEFEADYLIVGAGAVAMAFADTLISESDATAIMVDRRHRPGGHWNDAYPFVRLHGPSAYYGVNSRPLGSGRIDTSGLNEGLFELATASEICTYFDEVMRHDLQPTGRLTYLPLHDYRGDGAAVSLLGGRTVKLRARRKIVDATLADTRIPSLTPPPFEVAPGVRLLSSNDLPRIDGHPSRFVIIGAGKTAIDTVVWLLSNGADPDALTWVRPRDAWLLSRATVQPDYAFFEQTFGAFAANFEVPLAANSVEEIFLGLEARGCVRRVDPAVTPTMFRCAIISDQELALARQISDVVRLGHVRALEPGRIVLEGGEVAVDPDAVFVNCTACGIPRKPPQPIFQPGRIALQYVRWCSPTFSGALVAKVEITLDDDAARNALCAPVSMPDKPHDWMAMQLATLSNTGAWQARDELMKWLAGSRLDRFTAMAYRAQQEVDTANSRTLARYHAAIKPGAARLAQLIAQAAS